MVEKIFDISNMTAQALEEAANILNAYREYGVPEDFYDEGVQIAFNDNSGMVFLTNSEYQVAILGDEKLISWYYMPYTGIEGTVDELIDAFYSGAFEEDDDLEYLADICEINNERDIAKKIRERLSE